MIKSILVLAMSFTSLSASAAVSTTPDQMLKSQILVYDPASQQSCELKAIVQNSFVPPGAIVDQSAKTQSKGLEIAREVLSQTSLPRCEGSVREAGLQLVQSAYGNKNAAVVIPLIVIAAACTYFTWEIATTEFRLKPQSWWESITGAHIMGFTICAPVTAVAGGVYLVMNHFSQKSAKEQLESFRFEPDKKPAPETKSSN